VKVRGAAMKRATLNRPQAMLSVAGLDLAVLQRVCEESATGADDVCQVANMLFPQGFVCAGTWEAIQRLQDAAEKEGASQTKLLKTSGAFHTCLMEPAKAALEHALTRLLPNMRPPTCDVYLNLTGERIRAGTPPSEIVPLLTEQLVSPVLWAQIVQAMLNDGISEFFEVGPSRQLKAMMRRIDSNAWQAMTCMDV